MHTFYWHDYETFGINPRRDRPSQFAGIRTDAELNEIGKPLNIFCKPAPDYLPDPEACLLTGITPQHCLENGMDEFEFAARIEAELATPETVSLGYNTIRFDDEVTRFMFWRNLIEPYSREWQNDCSRWDLLDVVRTTYALRPEGIVWPTHDDGRPSFKLEHLTQANGISHEAAHDALSDVRATIALARLIRDKQPKLFDFCFSLRKKDKVLEQIGLPNSKPFLHISGMFSAERGCIALVWPLAMHPSNKNEVIVWDLAFDPSEIFTLDAETIRLRMFSKTADLPDGVTRLPIKSIHINKSPIVIGNLKTLSSERATHWNIDVEQALAHSQIAESAPDMSAIWQQVFTSEHAQADVDEDLYGGFIGNNDKRLLAKLRHFSPEELAKERVSFEDRRLEEVFFRYRARNFPLSLSPAELRRWEQHRAARLFDGASGARTLEAFGDAIDTLSENVNEQQADILSALFDYAESIMPDEE
ncbi:exodeoxyribonuclease I [Iodobacter ciconiae]|uniref:Exodeoxyribonuclease I n=1 Tax=Iodobacter ciconiae TaxID=2496266 RepID=A0A3S8ZW82_9NEIS|nr:exodeoxyribonuclease I [Iodobacter ciconiae]AZN37763.1 exodeoxyribonuclease I [Iodobacter ciconiae]